MAETIRSLLGEDTTLVPRNPTLSAERACTTLTALEHDALPARIWGGLHLRDAMEDGCILLGRSRAGSSTGTAGQYGRHRARSC